MTGAVLIANAVVTAMLVLLVLALFRSHADILRRLHALDGDATPIVGDDRGPAPDRTIVGGPVAHAISGVTLDGTTTVVAVRDVDHDTLLVFLSSGCLTCKAFWSAFTSETGVTLPRGTRLVIVTKDLTEESPSELTALAPRGVDLVASSQAWVDHEVPGSPYVIAVRGADGHIQGEGTGLSWEQVAGLLAQATGDRAYVVGDAGADVDKPLSDVEREARVDRELMGAGILPGDPSLYPDQNPTEED